MKPSEIYSLPDDALLTVKQAATIMNISESILREWIDDGKMNVMFIGRSKEMRIPRHYIRTWQTAQLTEPDEGIKRILSGSAS